jgi:hypothetical protein
MHVTISIARLLPINRGSANSISLPSFHNLHACQIVNLH